MKEEIEADISFHKEEIEVDLPKDEQLVSWLTQIANNEGKTISQLTYIFCSDDYLLEINKTYLDHDYYTDIITFPYRQGTEIESDIFISVDRVVENAYTHQVDHQTELLRVMSHGLLHLIGYGDKTEADQRKMTGAEDRCLQLWTDMVSDTT